MTRPYPAVVCVGLDGATFDVIDPMVAAGRLPTLAKLLSGGTRAALRSVIPPLSAPAWVSFMTGTNPGRHGVYHFRTLERDGIGATLVGSWAYKGTTIFDRASAAGRRVLAFRVPMTYPAWPVNGTMISGFPTPDPRTTYSEPPGVGARIGPLVQMNAMRSMVSSVADQAANFDFYLERSTDAIVELLAAGDVDFFCYVNSVTDWIAHKFWRFSDPDAPAYEPYAVAGGGTLIESFYEKVDDSLGRILAAAPDDALVVVLSDHGTGRRSTARFDTAAWLEGLGLFARAGGGRGPRGSGRRRLVAVLDWVKDVVPKKHWLWRHAPALVRTRVASVRSEKAAVDWSRARAYPVKLDHHVEGVNVNRELVGDRYEEVRDAVIAAAAFVPQLIGVHRREDVYSGSHADVAPDVILELDPAFEFGPGTSAPASRMKRSSATHRQDGILALAGPGVREGVDLGHASLLDVPATLMWALGLDVPAAMDGRVLSDAFDPDFVAAHPARIGDAGVDSEGPAAVYTADEEAGMAAHLEELGYL
ncbi:MAG: alkaline phosphatase family protein [Actinobacteria bacterium]|nr:alkaline phosphatase family protein [Actinomycetota bacterium]